MSVILDGKATSEKIKENIRQKCKILKEKYGISAKLAIVIVGDDAPSQIYVANKEKACKQTGIESVTVRLSGDISQEKLLEEVKKLAADTKIHGLMVQLPLPKGLNVSEVLSVIPPEKDVDGLTVKSGGLILFGEDGFTPCTAKGVIELLKIYGIDFKGKHAVVVGRSNMVGKPIALKLLENNCTVTVCHSRTENLANFTRQADILVVAVGKKHIITADMVKEGAVVVDVGMNRENGKLYGDVDYENVSKKASFITPVPGGVGPLTVTMLLSNTIDACLKKEKLSDIFNDL